MKKRKTKKNLNEIEVYDFDLDKNNKKEKSNGTKKVRNTEFVIVTYVFLALFIALSAYFVYFVQVKSSEFINSPYNARLEEFSKKTIRGEILSSDLQILAQTQTKEDGTSDRIYPFGKTFAHVVGYDTNGMMGIEQIGNFHLIRSNDFFIDRIIQELKGEKNYGDQLVTTLQVDVQQAAYEGIGSYKGALIAMEPSTGKVIAMVSKPDFDPNDIKYNWNTYANSDSKDAVLMNRCTQGLYPPGSTFKIITALSYIQQNSSYQYYEYDCFGEFEKSATTIHCYHNTAHGLQNFPTTFANSCNCAFVDIGLSMDIEQWQKSCNKLLFDQTLPGQFKPYKSSRFELNKNSTVDEIMQTSYGQGNTLVTPYHMCMIASAICNNGTLMEPYVLDYVRNIDGKTVRTFSQKEYGKLMSESDANQMTELMRGVVEEGTGRKLSDTEYICYGKTGTAEFTSDKDDMHSWFVGFARNEQGKDIAVAIICENAGTGSSYAVPLARKVFDAYFY